LASVGGLPATQNTWQNYTVTFTTGASVSGDLTLMLSAIGSGTIQADFDNVRLTVTPIPLTPPATPVTVNNFNFESNVAANGADISTVPTGWTGFNKAFVDDRGTGHPNGTQYTANNPLGAPAAGNQYCWVNVFSAVPVGGVYQDTGPLRSNTVYTLTVAIGSRKDLINSPGIISLVNGANNNGTVLTSGGGISATQDTWRDYSVTYITGATVNGDLTILLSVIGNDSTIQADFDNVRLTKAPLFFTAPVLGAAKIAGGDLILTGTNGTPNSGYTWLVTTNLAAPVWQTNSTGTLDANGAFSNSLPMNLSGQAGFFRLRVP